MEEEKRGGEGQDARAVGGRGEWGSSSVKWD